MRIITAIAITFAIVGCTVDNTNMSKPPDQDGESPITKIDARSLKDSTKDSDLDASTESSIDGSLDDANLEADSADETDGQEIDAFTDDSSESTEDSSFTPAFDADDARTEDAAVDSPDERNRDGGSDTGPIDSGADRDAQASWDSSDGKSQESAPPACVPVNCGTHSWACWKMPNAPSSGLPNPMRFADLGDGSVRDEVTCLVWDKTVTASSAYYTYDEFGQYCEQTRAYGSTTQWRRPTRIELESIVDDTRKSPSTADIFGNVPYDTFWTYSIVASDATRAWGILFYDGLDKQQKMTGSYYGRCVHGNGDGNLPLAAPADHYQLAQDTVYDRYTGLTWQRGESTAPVPYSQAMSYCAALGTLWRLPSSKELTTLVNDARTTPAIDTSAFPSMLSSAYWSATTYAGSDPSVETPWQVDFTTGMKSRASSSAYAKCVK
jgi:hypothetical protein